MNESLVSSVLAMAVLILQPNVDSAIEQDWVARIRSECPLVLDKYRLVTANAEEISESVHIKNPDDKDKKYFAYAHSQTIRRAASRVGSLWFFEMVRILEQDKDKPSIQLRGANDQYAFNLVKSRLDGSYSLAGYNPRGDRDNDGIDWLHTKAYLPLETVIRAVDGSDMHSVNAVRWDDERKLLCVSYSVKAGSKLGRETELGEVWLDPGNQWRVVETTSKNPNATSRVVLTYGVTVGGLSFPTRCQADYRESASSDHASSTLDWKMTALNKSVKTPLDFRLTAFNLPEPTEFPLPKSTPKYYWILASAGAFACLALGFRAIARRQANSSAA